MVEAFTPHKLANATNAHLPWHYPRQPDANSTLYPRAAVRQICNMTTILETGAAVGRFSLIKGAHIQMSSSLSQYTEASGSLYFNLSDFVFSAKVYERG